MLIIAGTLDVAPEQRAEVLALAEALMRATNEEPGNHEYLFTPDPFDAGRIRIFERWESEEALASHFGQPHMAEFGGALGKLDVRGSDLTKYSISDFGPLRG